MTLKALTFDLDNTLFDFFLMKEQATLAAAQAMVKAGVKRPIAALYRELFSYYLTDIEGDRVFGRFMREQGIYSRQALRDAILAYNRAKKNWMVPYPHVRATLASLKKSGLKLGIITDAPRLKARHRLEALGLERYFDCVVALEATGRAKPSRLPFQKAISKLKVKPTEAMHVGDWCARDIRGAKAVGMRTCLVKYSKTRYCRGRYVKPDHEIKDFRQLKKIAQEINKSRSA